MVLTLHAHHSQARHTPTQCANPSVSRTGGSIVIVSDFWKAPVETPQPQTKSSRFMWCLLCLCIIRPGRTGTVPVDKGRSTSELPSMCPLVRALVFHSSSCSHRYFAWEYPPSYRHRMPRCVEHVGVLLGPSHIPLRKSFTVSESRCCHDDSLLCLCSKSRVAGGSG